MVDYERCTACSKPFDLSGAWYFQRARICRRCNEALQLYNLEANPPMTTSASLIGAGILATLIFLAATVGGLLIW